MHIFGWLFKDFQDITMGKLVKCLFEEDDSRLLLLVVEIVEHIVKVSTLTFEKDRKKQKISVIEEGKFLYAFDLSLIYRSRNSWRRIEER